MTEEEKQKLNEKLVRWVGFEFKIAKGDNSVGEPSNVFIMKGQRYIRYPDGDWDLAEDMPQFTNSLDACFEWLVPKLQSTNRGFVLCDSQGKPPYHGEIYTYNTAFGEAHAATAKDKDPALALCLAIEKVIEMRTV